MSASGRPLAAVFLLLLLLPTAPALAQYMFLDANGDGINNESDRIGLEGPTTIDIWFDTDSNRDGSPAVCDRDPGTALDLFSWEVVLRAVGGTVEWGPLRNELPLGSIYACFASQADTTDPVWYHNGWGSAVAAEPGLHRVASLRVRVLEGEPSILVVPYYAARPGNLTSFGTHCAALDDDYTYKLGWDWFDADGIVHGLVPDAGGPYLAYTGREIQFTSAATLNPSGSPLTFDWSFGDGAVGSGPSPTHAYELIGDYRVTLTVSDGATTRSTWTTAHIVKGSPPVARVGGPYIGAIGLAVHFDGRGSSDPEGDPLTFLWDFGDGQKDQGAYSDHTYFTSGLFMVSLTVSDGLYTDSDQTTARISSTLQHPPIADAGGPYSGYAGARIQMDGSGSSDPDGDQLTFRWMFGDGFESTLQSPRHAYAEPDNYEVFLTVTDGFFTAENSTSATIVPPVGAPPVVSIGGPYGGTVGSAIAFNAAGSSDPDGGALTYEWQFGDGSIGAGSSPSHAYGTARMYTVTVLVSDGVYEVPAWTTASVRSDVPLKSRAWFVGGLDEIALGTLQAPLTIRVEPVGGSYQIQDVNFTRVTLRTGDGRGAAITAGYAAPTEDSDGNGVAEIAATFTPRDIRALLSAIDRPRTIDLVMEGALLDGSPIDAGLSVRVVPAGSFAAVVRPNPFNPRAAVTFMTSKPGVVRAHLFDLEGRMVRTVLPERLMQAGAHELAIEARSDGGGSLASGIYFLRIASPDGPVTVRVAVAK